MDDPITIRRIPSHDWTWLQNSLIHRYLRKIGPAAFALYAVLAMYAAEGNGVPSKARLCRDTGFSPKALRHAITALENIGLLVVTTSYLADGSQATNLYLLQDPDNLPCEVVLPREAVRLDFCSDK